VRRPGWLTFSAVVLIITEIIAIAIMVIYGLSAQYAEQTA
jgi:hypothetical protein